MFYLNFHTKYFSFIAIFILFYFFYIFYFTTEKEFFRSIRFIDFYEDKYVYVLVRYV